MMNIFKPNDTSCKCNGFLVIVYIHLVRKSIITYIVDHIQLMNLLNEYGVWFGGMFVTVCRCSGMNVVLPARKYKL